MGKLKCGVLALLWPALSCLAQNAPPQITPLTIGDTVPDLVFSNIINYKSKTAKLSDFKGKVVILDFWELGCGSCMVTLSKLQALQQQFTDNLKVITVTSRGTDSEILSSLSKIKLTKNVQLPILVHDKVLRSFFPFELISHLVWIDSGGVLRATTTSEYLQADNVREILKGKQVNWLMKKDAVAFDYNSPLLELKQLPFVLQSSPLFYTAFTGHIEGVDHTNRTLIDSIKQTFTKTYFNNTLLQLARVAMENQSGAINPKLLVLEVKDKDSYLFSSGYKNQWNKTHNYCYSIALPLFLSEPEKDQRIRKDLSRWLQLYFGIRLTKEIRSVNCLALIPLKNYRSVSLSDPDTTFTPSFSNLHNLIWHLNEHIPEIPWIINETEQDQNFPIRLKVNIDPDAPISSLRESLRSYGLDVVPVKRNMELYVLQEIHSNVPLFINYKTGLQ